LVCTGLYGQRTRLPGEDTANKIKLVFGRCERGRIWDFRWAGWLLSGYGSARLDRHFAYENAGVSADWRFAVLELSTYNEVSGSNGLSRFDSLRFLCFRGLPRLDFVKLTGRALEVGDEAGGAKE
jgi:hypothetical protein